MLKDYEDEQRRVLGRKLKREESLKLQGYLVQNFVTTMRETLSHVD